MTPLVAGLVAGAVLTLAGCSPDSVPAPGPARIDVDTPQLRELKQEAGVERLRARRRRNRSRAACPT